MDSPRVLVLGSDLADEMRPVRAALSDWPAAHVQRIPSADALSTVTEIPEVVLVCQRHPDEFAAADVRELLTRFPLSRLICAYGAWCEGDGRTRDVWPLATRVPVADFASRFQRELKVVAGRAVSLPLTASRTETFSVAPAEEWPGPVIAPRPVTVLSPDRAWRETLEAALREAGIPVVSAVRDARTVVWDADPETDAQRQRREELRGGLRPDQALLDAVGFCHVAVSGPSVWKLAPLSVIVRQIRERGS